MYTSEYFNVLQNIIYCFVGGLYFKNHPIYYRRYCLVGGLLRCTSPNEAVINQTINDKTENQTFSYIFMLEG
jgi:hypothetical protein